ncbi:MAG: efflux RND transporter periplasmic adaptor subunit [Parachlamydia sp.]|jgi:RND family efflux transporter MFP subunit|nr:efflux RND transporter periplasmic adaptor subunit [Parachlamydia sp.]
MYLKMLLVILSMSALLRAEEPQRVPVTVILDPLERVEIFPEIFEEIEKIPYRLGESFRKGDLLLKMKNQFYISQRQKALKGLEFAKENLKIQESLYKDKLISTLEIIKAEGDLATAQNNLDEATRNLDATIVIAPFDGKIGLISVREYERPVRQKSMMQIFNDRVILAKFFIPAHLLPRFSIGQTLPIFVKDLQKKFPAKVTRIGAEINPVSLTVNLEAEIENWDGSLIPGMSSYLEIEF